MNVTNTTNSTGTGGEAGPDAFYVWLTTIFAYGTWAVGIYMAIAILLVWRLGLYSKYPGFLIRWVLYLECVANLIVGPIKWWPSSPFHEVLVLAPTAGSCYFTILYDTFIGIGVIFCSTVAAYAIYKLSSGTSTARATGEEGACCVTVLFWVVAGGLAVLNISQGYVVKAWCVSTSRVVIGFKVAVAFFLIAVQVCCLVMFAWKLIGHQKNMMSLNSSGASNRKSSLKHASMLHALANVPVAQRQLLIRFLVLLFSQFITWVPLIWSEFTLIFWTPPSMPLLKLLCVGFFLGGFMDATAALCHRNVYNYLFCFRSARIYSTSNCRTSQPTVPGAPRTKIQASVP